MVAHRLLGVEDLETFIAVEQVQAEILRLDRQTPTVELAAQAVGAQPEDIVKSLVFLVEGRPVLAIACGTRRVDTRRVAAHFQVGRKRVHLAGPEAVLAATGYAVGALPPFGHSTPLPTLIDRQVLARRRVYAGGGAIDALVQTTPAEIVRVTGAETIDLGGPADDS